MRQAALKEMMHLATTTDGPVARIVADSIEEGINMIVPSILTKNLEAAKFTIGYFKDPLHKEPLAESDKTTKPWMRITTPGKKGPVIVAQAYSESKHDALLQAMYAWLKEEITEPLETVRSDGLVSV